MALGGLSGGHFHTIWEHFWDGLLQPRQLVGDDLGARGAVAAAIEGPGAAEGAVPGTAPGELDRQLLRLAN
jgi:hypothetical protein